jgi:hypothetical protein
LGFYFAKKKKKIRQNKTIYCWAGSGADIAWIYFVEKEKKKKQNNYCWKHSSLGQVQKDLQATDICLGVFCFVFVFVFCFKFEREKRITVGP